jgi:hypothetical protein
MPFMRNRDRVTLLPLGTTKMMYMRVPSVQDRLDRQFEFLAEFMRGDDVFPSGWLARRRTTTGRLVEIPSHGQTVASVPQRNSREALDALHARHAVGPKQRLALVPRNDRPPAD